MLLFAPGDRSTHHSTPHQKIAQPKTRSKERHACLTFRSSAERTTNTNQNTLHTQQSTAASAQAEQRWLPKVRPVENNAKYSTAGSVVVVASTLSARPMDAMKGGGAVQNCTLTAPAGTSDAFLPLGARRQVRHEQRRVAGVRPGAAVLRAAGRRARALRLGHGCVRELQQEPRLGVAQEE
jgi:hypothetical protein